MKKSIYISTTLILVLFVLNFEANCQNIVQNPSWEINTGIPVTQGEVGLATGWEVLITNSDYMHNDGFAGWTPINGGAYDGDGFVGLGGYEWDPEYSEALGGFLATPIVAGQNYAVSVALQLTNAPSGAGNFSFSCVGVSIFGFVDYDTDEFFPGHLNDIDGSVLLWTSDVVDNNEWEIYTGCFQAPSDVNFIGLSMATNITCATYVFIDLLEIIPVDESVLGDDLIICDGESVFLEAPSYADSYTWSDGSDDLEFEINTSGTYWIDYTIGTCSISDTINVSIEEIIDFDLGPDQDICEGESVTLFAPIDYDDYEWQDGTDTDEFIVENSGTYSISIDYDNCTFLEEVEIEFISPPVIDLGADQTLCDGESVVLNAATINGVYDWNDGSDLSTLIVESDGVYSVDVYVLENCGSSDEVTISFSPLPYIELGADILACVGDEIILEPETNSENLFWNTGSSDMSISIFNSGNYEVTATTNGCQSSDNISVVLDEYYIARLPSDTLLCENQTLNLNITSESAQYNWSTGAIEPSVSIVMAGDYSVLITNPCEVEEQFISVEFHNCDCQIFIPNAVTLDNDNINELFKPQSICEFAEYQLTIFNRWGEIVFESNDSQEYWNGGEDDHYVKDGVYDYFLEYRTIEEIEKTLIKGFVMVVR